MATYFERRLKSGKTNYGIQICVRDSSGKSKFINTTWTNPDNLTGKRLEKALHAYGENWERDYRNGHTHELSLANFDRVANVWLKARKSNMSESYYMRASDCIKRMSEFFGDKPFTTLKAYDIQQFFIYLNDYKFKTTTAVIKSSKKEKFNEIALNCGIRKVCEQAEFSRPTLYYARCGIPVSILSAKLICDKFGLNFNEYFDKIEVANEYRKETILKYKRVLSAIFTYCISIELVTVNYASSSYLKQIIGGRPAKEITILSESEYRSFLTTLDRYDKENEINIIETIPLYLMAMLGLRSCEVCGLEWQDIDFAKRYITIRRDRVYVKGRGVMRRLSTKSYSGGRALYICDRLLNKLKAFKQVYDKLSKADKCFDRCGALFCNIDGTPRFPQYLNTLLTKFLVKANCPRVSCHKIRHTWITRLISTGVSVNNVSRMAGHASSDITLKIYTHYCKDIDNSKEVLEKIFAI